MDRAAHWDRVWSTRDPTETSWHQDDPRTSLELIRASGADPAAPLLDVGGGASRLVDALLDAGHTDVTVMDVAAPALDAARTRLGPRADRVNWLVADVTRAELGGPYRLWHDRAVLHFLTDEADRAAYADRMRAAVAPGGHAVLATFAPDGPERCSDLPVQRYDAGGLAAFAGPGWRLVGERREEHRTPWDAAQSFQYVLLQRTDEDGPMRKH